MCGFVVVLAFVYVLDDDDIGFYELHDYDLGGVYEMRWGFKRDG